MEFYAGTITLDSQSALEQGDILESVPLPILTLSRPFFNGLLTPRSLPCESIASTTPALPFAGSSYLFTSRTSCSILVVHFDPSLDTRGFRL